ncbi:histidine phosphatase family protein [Leucobacter sp. USHLN153]|uniref:histidine phosphatase family protein n=1 Tax=Leucobacter sp. USHLN153 TaxID=3081268 RepID=UPI00301695F8
MRVALIRHGQTDWNLAGRMQGRTDTALNATGRGQALELAARLSLQGPWHAVVTSPLARAASTAELLAQQLGISEVVPCEGLVERSFGHAEGLSPDEARDRWPTRVYPEMEHPDETAVRGERALAAIASRFPGQRVIAVSHGSFIRHLLAHLAGVEVQSVPRIPNVGVAELERDSDGGWRIEQFEGAPWSLSGAEAAPPSA